MKKMGPHENDLSVVPYTCPDSCKVSSLLQRQLAHVLFFLAYDDEWKKMKRTFS